MTTKIQRDQHAAYMRESEAATMSEGRSQPATKMTVAEAAKYFKRTERSIQRWCEDGTLLAFNYPVIRERCGRWIILIPNQ